MRCTQRLKYVAAQIDKCAYAGPSERGFRLAWPAGEVDVFCAGSTQSFRGFDRVARVDLVRRTQADEAGTGGIERGKHLFAACKSVIRDGLDAAGLEEILGVGCPCREVGQTTEIGEEDFRPSSGLFQRAVGSVTQCFKGLGEAKTGKGRE